MDFDYECPVSLDEVCRRLAAAGGEAKIIAGGQTLVPLLAMRLARPALLIDINRVPELSGIEETADGLAIRACTRQAAALADPRVRARVPLLAKALGFVGHIQTRNRGTIGGSLANADPAAEIGLAALTLDAEIEARTRDGTRTIPLGGFFLGPMETQLAPDECLACVRFPVWRDGRIGTGFQEVSVRQSDFALAAAAVQVALDPTGLCRRAAISVGGAGATPMRIPAAEARLCGTRLEAGDTDAAAAIVRGAVNPLADPHASPAYRRRIAGALVARAIAEARTEAAP
ncbi:MAG TPA: xanthine dehydrogenase family protein subunit M [Stellaceae bacterium]|nr:xanthine dehydrogenase family protein subunit M [Stellaceae bacterium]